MSKRRKKKDKPRTPSKFQIGDRVRVKHGIRDEDHPDIPLGGWVGTITEIHRHGIYSIQWSPETLASIHPIYKRRCTIDGTVLREYWIEEDDLEADPGGPLFIEQPTQITPVPLSCEDQGDRVRMVFGLTSDDFLPCVDKESLEIYYHYLTERMSFPFKARHFPEEEGFVHRSSARWGHGGCSRQRSRLGRGGRHPLRDAHCRRGAGCAADEPGNASHRPELPTGR